MNSWLNWQNQILDKPYPRGSVCLMTLEMPYLVQTPGLSEWIVLDGRSFLYHRLRRHLVLRANNVLRRTERIRKSTGNNELKSGPEILVEQLT